MRPLYEITNDDGAAPDERPALALTEAGEVLASLDAQVANLNAAGMLPVRFFAAPAELDPELPPCA